MWLRFLVYSVRSFQLLKLQVKGVAVSKQAWTGPLVFQEFDSSRFRDILHMNVVKLWVLRTSRLYPPPQEVFLVLISVTDLFYPQGHNAAGRIMAMKNSNNTIGNRTRAVPQTTVLRRALSCRVHIWNLGQGLNCFFQVIAHIFS